MMCIFERKNLYFIYGVKVDKTIYAFKSPF